jgi:NAD(P)-dependent dehydrogenase (short-subunit alcohol dehydrogenase family)
VHIGDIDVQAVAEVVDAHENTTGSVTAVSDAAAVDGLLRDVRNQLGGLDVLVNNAGIGGPTAPAEDLALTTGAPWSTSTCTAPSSSPKAPSRCSRSPTPPPLSPCPR